MFYQLSENQKNQIQQELGSLLKDKMSLKQSLKQQGEQTEAESEQLFLELLEVFDALEFLLDYIESHPEPNPKFIKRLPKSISTIQKKLLNILAKRQVRQINLEDTKANYNICQVVDREEREDLEEQTITKIVRQGFKLESKILRPVEVITSKKPSI